MCGFIFQVISDLLGCLSDNMWDLPINQAVTDARLEEISLLAKLEQVKPEHKLSEICVTSSRSADQVDTGTKTTLTSSISGSLTPYTHANKEENSELSKGENSGGNENEKLDAGKEYEKRFSEGYVTMMEVTFDAEKCVCSSVEGGQTLIHSSAGKGYGIAAIPVSSGCYMWKVFFCCQILSALYQDNAIYLKES